MVGTKHPSRTYRTTDLSVGNKSDHGR